MFKKLVFALRNLFTGRRGQQRASPPVEADPTSVPLGISENSDPDVPPGTLIMEDRPASRGWPPWGNQDENERLLSEEVAETFTNISDGEKTCTEDTERLFEQLLQHPERTKARKGIRFLIDGWENGKFRNKRD